MVSRLSEPPSLTEGNIFYGGWFIALGACVAIAVSFGVRSAFGTVITPLEFEFGWSRIDITTAASINLLLYGVCQPAVGGLVDRYGGRWILTTSIILISVGTYWLGHITSLWELYVAYGVVIGLGIALASPVSVSAAVAPHFSRHRGMATSIANAGSPIGQLVFVPLAMFLILYFGFSDGFSRLGLGLLVVALPITIALFIYARGYSTRVGQGSEECLEKTSLKSASQTRIFWILVLAMLVCGYTSAGVTITHIIPYAACIGISPMVGATGLALIGLANFVGVMVTGYLGDRVGREPILAVLFAIRAVSHILVLASDNEALFLFAAVIYGSTHSATMTTTAAIIGDRFGRHSVGLLYGWLLLGHQIFAALGAFVGGMDYELNASYTVTFSSAVLLSLIASLTSLTIWKRKRFQLDLQTPS